MATKKEGYPICYAKDSIQRNAVVSPTNAVVFVLYQIRFLEDLALMMIGLLVGGVVGGREGSKWCRCVLSLLGCSSDSTFSVTDTIGSLLAFTARTCQRRTELMASLDPITATTNHNSIMPCSIRESIFSLRLVVCHIIYASCAQIQNI